jgi:hypothetical protein
MPSTAEKRKIIRRSLLAAPECSNRMIAMQCGVDGNTVATVRTLMEQSGELPQVVVRYGRDGRRRDIRGFQGVKKLDRPFTTSEKQLIERAGFTGSMIYLLEMESRVKIGVTASLLDRVRKLLFQYPTANLTALALGNRNDEQAVHRFLQPQRVHGEWFECPLDEVLQAMRRRGLAPITLEEAYVRS